MINRRSLLRTSSAALCAGALAGWATESAAQPLYVIPFQYYGGRIYVQVSGPRVDQAWFVLDTGAPVTCYTLELVARAGLPHGGRIGISGTGATRIAGTMVQSTTLRVGDVPLHVARGVAAPSDALFGDVYRGSGRRFDGIIGHDLFAAFAVEIDYLVGEIRLHRKGSTRGGSALRLIAGKPYLAVELAADEVTLPAQMHLDTGFGGILALNGRFVAEHAMIGKVGATLPSWTRGVGGITEARLARLRSVRLAGHDVERPIVSLSLVQGVGVHAESAGRIGGEMLRRFVVRLDYSAGRVTLTPQPIIAEPFETDMSGLTLLEEDAISVQDVATGTSAAEAGLRAGDRIVEMDGERASTLNLEQLRARLRHDGRSVRLLVERDHEQLQVQFTLRRRL